MDGLQIKTSVWSFWLTSKSQNLHPSAHSRRPSLLSHFPVWTFRFFFVENIDLNWLSGWSKRVVGYRCLWGGLKSSSAAAFGCWGIHALNVQSSFFGESSIFSPSCSLMNWFMGWHSSFLRSSGVLVLLSVRLLRRQERHSILMFREPLWGRPRPKTSNVLIA